MYMFFCGCAAIPISHEAPPPPPTPSSPLFRSRWVGLLCVVRAGACWQLPAAAVEAMNVFDILITVGEELRCAALRRTRTHAHTIRVSVLEGKSVVHLSSVCGSERLHISLGSKLVRTRGKIGFGHSERANTADGRIGIIVKRHMGKLTQLCLAPEKIGSQKLFLHTKV